MVVCIYKLCHNTPQVVEHWRSKRKTQLRFAFPLYLFCALELSLVYTIISITDFARKKF